MFTDASSEVFSVMKHDKNGLFTETEVILTPPSDLVEVNRTP